MLESEINKACAYIRVGTRKQKEEGEHEKQRNRLQSWAGKRDVKMDLYEDIAIDGQSENRQQYEIMMDRLEEYDALVVWELGSLGRNIRKILNDIETLESEDVEFVSLSENLDTSGAQGKLLFQIVAAFNEFYASMKREESLRMVEMKRHNKHQGPSKKLSDGEIEQCEEWREAGLGYEDISRMVELEYGEEIDPSTVYRYLNEED